MAASLGSSLTSEYAGSEFEVEEEEDSAVAPSPSPLISKLKPKNAANVVMTRMFADHLIDSFEDRNEKFQHDHHFANPEEQAAAMRRLEATGKLDGDAGEHLENREEKDEDEAEKILLKKIKDDTLCQY